MTTDITELAQRMSIERIKQIALGGTPTMGEKESLAITALYFSEELKIATDAFQAAGRALLAAEEALEKAQQVDEELCKLLPPGVEYMDPPDGGDVTPLEGVRRMVADYRQRIAELEREQEHLRPVGVMSEQAFHRLENSECRFIALWPRPGIFLQRKRPEDGVLVYARTAAAAGIKVEAE
ncbi:hypothetical protein [Klebsiella quasipneumoniae]|uniref:hypothetical protein n=1 Tax=Klebsiella quasipneumoniae TaxID=1463165 RepID=UPI002B05B1A8|nr:hypothetical protein [Klebsiella quasipneumoniae]